MSKREFTFSKAIASKYECWLDNPDSSLSSERLRGHQFPRRLRQRACSSSEPLGSAAGRSQWSSVSSSKSKMTLDLALARASVHADEKSKMSLKDPIQSENGGAHLPEFTEVGRALDWEGSCPS